MNAEKLLKYIASPQSLNKESLEEIETLVQLFPYSQNIQLLYLFNLSNTQDIRFGEQLQKTATYTADRRLLKKQIEELKKPVLSIPKEVDIKIEQKIEPVSEAFDSDTVLPIQDEKHIVDEHADIEIVDEPLIASESISEKLKYANLEDEPFEDLIIERNKIRSKAELLQLVKNRLAEIDVFETKKPAESISEEAKSAEKEAPLKNKLDLIDKFISIEPSISRPEKTAFFDPNAAAQESLFDDGAFVTETLAKIYYDQGNYQKAKEIYQVLSLNNPKKSSYFAALIQELENKLN
ncbi:MAG: hypothetical protein PF484_05720 [Bacteroidales bacterium]|jgi:tetratricopeptide (TPR) repeat protein|nr:hypothetical protein [Bacteroidales bacterium]